MTTVEKVIAAIRKASTEAEKRAIEAAHLEQSDNRPHEGDPE